MAFSEDLDWSWKTYSKNLGDVLAVKGIGMGLMFAAMVPLILILIVTIPIGFMAAPMDGEGFLWMFCGAFVFMFVAIFILSAFIQAGTLGTFRDIATGQYEGAGSFFTNMKRYGGRILGLILLIMLMLVPMMLVVGGLVVLMFVPGVMTSADAFCMSMSLIFVLLIILGFAMAVIAIVQYMGICAIVSDGCSSSTALKRGWVAFKGNAGEVIGAYMLYMLVSFIINNIPLIGALASYFLLMPLLELFVLKVYMTRTPFEHLKNVREEPPANQYQWTPQIPQGPAYDSQMPPVTNTTSYDEWKRQQQSGYDGYNREPDVYGRPPSYPQYPQYPDDRTRRPPY